MEIPATLLMSSGMHAYVAVKASIHASDSAVFGLNDVEITALTKRFNNHKIDVVNGVLIKAAPIQVINALAELGYKVVSTCGEAEIIWTLQRDI